MEPGSSSPYSQVPAICPYPEPTPSIMLHNIATLVYNDTEYPLHDVITEFDCTFQIVTFSSWS